MSNKARRSGRSGRQASVDRRPVVDVRKRELLLATLIRNRTAFDAVKDVLAPSHLQPVDGGMALLWRLALDFEKAHGMLPSKEFLAAEMEEAYAANPGLLTDAELVGAQELLDLAFDSSSFQGEAAGDIRYADWATRNASRFLEEQVVADMQADIVAGRTIPSDMPAYLSGILSRTQEISALQAGADELAFEEGWDRKISLNLTPTGVDYINMFLGGGDAPGEVYGLLGPFGSAKTTIAYQLLVERAKHFAQVLAGGGPHLVAAIFSYEAPRKEMQERALGYGARINRDRIAGMQSIADLSTATSLQPYEQERYRLQIAQGQPVQGERERALDMIELINRHIFLFDMTGGPGGLPGRGTGSFAEARSCLDHKLRQRPGVQVGFVAFDYLGAMVSRYMMARDIDNNELRFQIKGAGLEARSRIAETFRCPVWMLHQLTGLANQLGEAQLADHTRASESTSFAENLDFSLSIGKPNAQGLALFGCTKHRRQPARENAVIRIEGDVYRAVSVSAHFTIDPATRRIVNKNDAGRILGANRASAFPAATPEAADAAGPDGPDGPIENAGSNPANSQA